MGLRIYIVRVHNSVMYMYNVYPQYHGASHVLPVL